MTREEQIYFVRELSRTVTNDIVTLINAGKIPEDWNGIELRKYTGDVASECSRAILVGKRLKNYRHEIVMRNL